LVDCLRLSLIFLAERQLLRIKIDEENYVLVGITQLQKIMRKEEDGIRKMQSGGIE